MIKSDFISLMEELDKINDESVLQSEPDKDSEPSEPSEPDLESEPSKRSLEEAVIDIDTDVLNNAEAEMRRLNKELYELDKLLEKRKKEEWAKHKDKRDPVLDKYWELGFELDRLRNTYTTEIREPYDEDSSWVVDTIIDDEKKAAVAEREAELIKEIADFRAQLDEFENKVNAVLQADKDVIVKKEAERDSHYNISKEQRAHLANGYDEYKEEIEEAVKVLDFSDYDWTIDKKSFSYDSKVGLFTINAETEKDIYANEFDIDDYGDIGDDGEAVLTDSAVDSAIESFDEDLDIYTLREELEPSDIPDWYKIPNSSWLIELPEFIEIEASGDPMITNYEEEEPDYWLGGGGADWDYDGSLDLVASIRLGKKIK